MERRVVVIGGGGTGIAVSYDLSRRGFLPILCERGELTSGTTGRHHGQLHCGARYAMGDRRIAKECMHESSILRAIAPQAIEYNGGLFVSVTEEDDGYTEQFLDCCADSGIPAKKVPVLQVRELEPAVSPNIRSAVWVPDGTIDPWRLVLSFASGAALHGADLRPYTEVLDIEVHSGAVTGVLVRNRLTGNDERIHTALVVNAGGAWAGKIAALAGIQLDMSPSPGTMAAVRGRATSMVISRLHPAGDGDIIVPQRRLSIIGSTQWLAEDPDRVRTRSEDIPYLTEAADMMVPSFSSLPFHAAWSASRPLFGAAGNERVRELSRDFICINHGESGGNRVHGLVSIVGGKATTLRGMGEAAADSVCSIIGQHIPCSTADALLPGHRSYYSPGAKR